MSKLFDALLLLLLVGSVVAGEGWPGAHSASVLPDWLLRGAMGVIVGFVALKLRHLAQGANLPMVSSLRLLGTGVVVLLATEQLGWQHHGYLSVLGGTVASVGAVSLLLSLHNTLRT
jgi:hypothetical protein